MRITSGAFRSTPIESLHIVTNEPTLQPRREELLLRYFLRTNATFSIRPMIALITEILRIIS